MTIKEFFFLVLCMVVSLLAGYGVVKVMDQPLYSDKATVGGVFADTELEEFYKAVKDYGEEKDISEDEAFNHLKIKAKEYLKAKEEGRPINEDDESLQRLKAKAKEYLSVEESDRLRTMSENAVTELMKDKAKLIFDLDKEQF